jgi:hypothetical protein
LALLRISHLQTRACHPCSRKTNGQDTAARQARARDSKTHPCEKTVRETHSCDAAASDASAEAQALVAGLALRRSSGARKTSHNTRSRETRCRGPGARQARDSETHACETALRKNQARHTGAGDTSTEAQALVADFLTQTLAGLRCRAYKTLPRKNG